MTNVTVQEERSVVELTRTLSDQATHLLREEIELAKAELAVKTRRLGVGAGMFGVAALLAVFGCGALVAAAIAALSLVLATWLAALIVAGALALAIGLLALVGARTVRRAVPPVPEEATRSVKEDVRWAKMRAAQARK